MDAGAPPALAPYDRRAHAGTLGFEMSLGAERVVVNCGAFPAADAAWEKALRSTTAHSTVAVDDASSSELIAGGGFGRRVHAIECAREESEGNVWIVASHDGYEDNFGLIHRRRLYLAAGGDDFRGEDSLVGPHRGHFTLRFHLHPGVQTSLIQNGAAAILRLPSGAAWRLQVNGGHIDVAESVYLGRRGEMYRAEQVVVAGQLTGRGATVKWAFKRYAKG